MVPIANLLRAVPFRGCSLFAFVYLLTRRAGVNLSAKPSPAGATNSCRACLLDSKHRIPAEICHLTADYVHILSCCVPQAIYFRFNLYSFQGHIRHFPRPQFFPQQFLYFLPLPQGQGPFRDGFPTTVSFGSSFGSSNRLICPIGAIRSEYFLPRSDITNISSGV